VRSWVCTYSGSGSRSSSASTKPCSLPRQPNARDRSARDAPVRKVLLVSYTFPPQYDVSARRAAKLCKYLPAHGWQPVVLTKDWERDVAPEDRRAYRLSSYPQALDELAGVTIVKAPYRTRDNALRRVHQRLGGVYEATRGDHHANGIGAAWSPRGIARRALSLLSPTFGDFPDPFRGWVDAAVRTGVDVVRRESIDAICSLCPPASAHVVASEIARLTRVPWLAQFDDLYSFHLERQRRPAWRPYADRQHRRWMKQAAAASAITPAMLEYVRRTYGVEGDVVMVGFDPDERPAVEPDHRERLRLAYTGSVYPGDQRPELFFEALERVVASHGGSTPPLEVTFAGTGCDPELQAVLKAYPNAARACVFVERLPPDDALRLQRQADGLVMFNCTAPTPDEGTLSFPAKTFEYLNAGRPILALPSDPGGWGDDLLDRTGTGVTANSVADIAAVLEQWLRTWAAAATLRYNGDPAQIARYAQPRQAAVLARLLDRAVASR
jgi:glycosyltransferase involved in cell wall biosynthesis